MLVLSETVLVPVAANLGPAGIKPNGVELV